MKKKKKYFAFISYSHKDAELANWLQHEFEYYEGGCLQIGSGKLLQ